MHGENPGVYLDLCTGIYEEFLDIFGHGNVASAALITPGDVDSAIK